MRWLGSNPAPGPAPRGGHQSVGAPAVVSVAASDASSADHGPAPCAAAWASSCRSSARVVTLGRSAQRDPASEGALAPSAGQVDVTPALLEPLPGRQASTASITCGRVGTTPPRTPARTSLGSSPAGQACGRTTSRTTPGSHPVTNSPWTRAAARVRRWLRPTTLLGPSGVRWTISPAPSSAKHSSRARSRSVGPPPWIASPSTPRRRRARSHTSPTHRNSGTGSLVGPPPPTGTTMSIHTDAAGSTSTIPPPLGR